MGVGVGVSLHCMVEIFTLLNLTLFVTCIHANDNVLSIC